MNETLTHPHRADIGAATPSVPVAPLVLAGAIIAAGAVGLMAFSEGGASLFVTLIETGMAWCF